MIRLVFRLHKTYSLQTYMILKVFFFCLFVFVFVFLMNLLYFFPIHFYLAWFRWDKIFMVVIWWTFPTLRCLKSVHSCLPTKFFFRFTLSLFLIFILLFVCLIVCLFVCLFSFSFLFLFCFSIIEYCLYKIDNGLLKFVLLNCFEIFWKRPDYSWYIDNSMYSFLNAFLNCTNELLWSSLSLPA